MSFRKFKFVSPGVFINEIDKSQLPAIPEDIGPVVIGRAEKGPALTPIRVNSFADFIDIFGNPMPGGEGGDVWRLRQSVCPYIRGICCTSMAKKQLSFDLREINGPQQYRCRKLN